MDTLKARLLSYTYECEDDCWHCLAGGKSAKYGKIWYRGRVIDNHIASWIAHNGQVPEGKFVLHTCDYKRCINPDHLFLGTQQTNIDDMIAKGRKASQLGSNHGQALLNENKVVAIKRMLDEGEYTIKELADKFKVHPTTIGSIKAGRTWIHV